MYTGNVDKGEYFNVIEKFYSACADTKFDQITHLGRKGLQTRKFYSKKRTPRKTTSKFYSKKYQNYILKNRINNAQG